MANFKNIVGSGFPDYINTQIKKRGEIISNKNRNNNSLQFLSNRNIFVRLSSSVNIGGSDALARNNVLQGGTLNNNRTLKKGFNETYKKGTDDDLGFKPMPGIVNTTIGTGGKWQTLMQADIEFVCYDLGQLDTMTKLYMSLGCSVFLEWGHSNYIKNDNTFESNPSLINFFGINDRDDLLKKATDKRKNTNGNYECLLGKVYNFDWNANNDGSYNCKIQIMGSGGIVESLKINTAGATNFDIFTDETDESYGDYSSYLESVLSGLKSFIIRASDAIKIQKRQGKVSTQFVEIGLDSAVYILNKDLRKTYAGYLNELYAKTQYKGPRFTANGLDSFNINVVKGNAHQFISGYDTEIPNISSNLYKAYSSQTTIDDSKESLHYITLGHLFTLIQHFGIFSEGEKGNSKPVVYLDYHPENTIIKTPPLRASIDPSKCLIPYITTLEHQDLFFNNIFVEYPDLKIKDLLTSENYPDNIPAFQGKLFNVLINIDFALDTLKRLSSSSNDPDVNFMDYITQILDGVNVSLGKVNSFRPFHDKDSNCLRIIDENVLPEQTKENEVITIPNFGTNSLIYDYSFNTKLSPQLANQIVIGAQASDSIKDFPDDVLSYQYFNGGAIDRFAKEKIAPIGRNDIFGPPKINNLPYRKLYNHLANVYDFSKNIKKETISQLTTLYNDLQNKDLKKPKQITTLSLIGDIARPSFVSAFEKRPSIVIPIEYSIKIDGISGILPYSVFRIPDDRLPRQYRGRIDFAVFSINHEIEDNKWYTVLRGQVISRPN